MLHSICHACHVFYDTFLRKKQIEEQVPVGHMTNLNRWR